MKKLKLVIISEKTRYHFQRPLEFFKNVKVYHLYKTCYPDMNPKEFKSNLIKYSNIFDLWKKLKKIKPNVVQGLEPYYGYSRFKIPIKILLILCTTYRYCIKTNTPYFFHMLENIKPEVKYGKFAGLIMKKIASIYSKKAKFIFYLNNKAKENLLSLGIDKNKISYGLWGIWGLDKKEFYPSGVNYNPKREYNILYLGRLIEQKGLMDLLLAMKDIVKKNSDVKLTIVGDGPLKEQLVRDIQKYKISNKVDFIGSIPNNQTVEYYQKAYISVCPSRALNYWQEQIGMSNLESMACGTPVVSTLTGSIPKYVKNNKTGLLVPEKSPQELAKAILFLIKNPKKREEFSKNCLKYIKEKFDAQKNVKTLEQFVISKIRAKSE